ncbi:Cell-death-related_nuclease 7 [Hexamita inflata]|uniref:Cell-death-related nuclease 7 n=1 Tax=Hexamita inflata TaxID=28002 RepID=A0AA86NFM8_9EUKA|nr:Cell-death-related nuclease 7 [Hexamita inflata]CAI9942756.1 Cell-death-related nuclease 7 [Hexamita inflata]
MIVLIPMINALSCLDLKGKEVDWFIEIKQNSSFTTVYMDKNNKHDFVTAPQINDSQNPAMLTIQQVFANKKFQTLMFNDQDSDDLQTDTLAHQKGVIAFDPKSMTGFYMLHTTPGWPNRQNETLIYDSISYGQDFLCINIDAKGLDLLGENLYVTRPQIYSNSFNATFLQSFAPYFTKVVAGQYNGKQNYTVTSFFSRGGQEFDLFFKNKYTQIEIWSELIAMYKNADMKVETWLRDSNAAPYCKTNTVEMVAQVKFGSKMWKETQDHSKWGINAEATFVCFADLNFQESQRKRGGGAFCLNDEDVAFAFMNAIVSMDDKLSC